MIITLLIFLASAWAAEFAQQFLTILMKCGTSENKKPLITVWIYNLVNQR